MANQETMKEIFDVLLKKYDGASQIREWNNHARNNMYDENERIRKQEIATYRRQFDEAKTGSNVANMKKVFETVMKRYDSASKIREWQNGASGVAYVENEAARKTWIQNIRKKFDAASE